jgi:hypothetical protein
MCMTLWSGTAGHSQAHPQKLRRFSPCHRSQLAHEDTPLTARADADSVAHHPGRRNPRRCAADRADGPARMLGQRSASVLTPGLPAEPVHIGQGIARTEFQAAWQGPGEHERGGGFEFVAKQAHRPGRLEPE